MKDLGNQSIGESHYKEKYMEKDCQQENIYTKKAK